jgi:multidrug efflux pump subunit AcrA (membrane-fusion protein)
MSFCLSGCSSEQEVKENVPLVRTLTIKSDEGIQKSVYPGEVCGRYESRLAFQVNGKIIERSVDLGSVVKAGDLLMQLDPQEFQHNVETLGAQLSSAKSQLNLAAENLNRYQMLYESNAISKAELDNYQNAYNSADELVKQITTQYDQAMNDLNHTNLYADINGVVASIEAEVGQMVGPSVVTSPPQVLTIVQAGEREGPGGSFRTFVLRRVRRGWNLPAKQEPLQLRCCRRQGVVRNSGSRELLEGGAEPGPRYIISRCQAITGWQAWSN